MSKVRLNDPGNLMNPFAELGNAVIRQAVKDYCTARKLLARNPDSKAAEGEIRSIKRFFYSEYFMLWTDLDGPALFEKVEKKMDEELTE